MSRRDTYQEGSSDARWLLPRVSGWLLGLAVLSLVFGAVMLIGATAFGWFSGEVGLRSFAHVRQTYAEAFDDTAAMDANARQACRVEQFITQAQAAGDTNTVQQRQTQLLAIENNYDHIKGSYEAYMNDHFRGGVIRPTQLPLPYPSLADRKTQVC